MSDFIADDEHAALAMRVQRLLRGIVREGGVANPFNNGWCQYCEAPSEFKMETCKHEDDCELAAVLAESCQRSRGRFGS